MIKVQNSQPEITKDEVKSAIKTLLARNNVMIQLVLKMKSSSQGVTHFSIQLQKCSIVF